MTKHGTSRRSGFTLVELCVATALLVIVISLTMVGLLHGVSSANESDVQAELDIDVQASMERIKQDVRLTSLDKCVFYPQGNGPYTAVSFPIAKVDTNGAVALATNGVIVWDRQIIYHVWFGAPSQLRKTTFNPQPAITGLQLQQQLDSVVTNGNGLATFGATNSTTEVVFQNLFTWTLTPRQPQYDGYATNLTRDVGVDLGFCLITNGINTLQFTVIGKKGASGGYAVGIDSLSMSPSYGLREGEGQLTNATCSGATPVAQFRNGGWDGNYELSFPATATGQYVTLSMENDRWEEANHVGSGSLCVDTGIDFDTSLSPMHYVVGMLGNTWGWYANEQTRDPIGSAPGALDSLKGCAVRVLLKGADMQGGEWIKFNGSKCYVWFDGDPDPSRKLKVEAVYIAECADSTNPSPDFIAGKLRQVTFSGGQPGQTFPAGYNWSDSIDFPINKRKSYVVSYLVGNGASMGNAWYWTDASPTGVQSYILPEAAAGDLTDPVWSTRTNLVTTNALLGVHYLWTRYPTNAFYTSPIYDTHLDAPAYSSIGWNAAAGGSLLMRVRTATNEFMADASAWTNITAQTTAGALNPYPGSRRYIQYQAELRSDSGGWSAPVIRDLTIRWPGADRMVDIMATMTKGPNSGIASLAVNGVALRQGLDIDLTIFQDIRSFGAQKRLTSSLNSELRPRNTGR